MISACALEPYSPAGSELTASNVAPQETVNEMVLGAPALQLDGGPASDAMVCRNVEVTGTRFPKRVCKPASEWADLQRRQIDGAREYVRQTIENSTVVSPGDGTQAPGARLY